MAAIIRFDIGASLGTNNRSRSDAVEGDTITVQALGGGASQIFGLLRRPKGSTASLSGSGSSRTFTADKTGKYRVRLNEDGDIQIHTITVRTARYGIAIPAFNERADDDANESDTDPGTWVDDSETNEGGLFTGYAEDVEEAMLTLAKMFNASDPVIVTDLPSANQNDYAPDSVADWKRCDIARILPNGSANITVTGLDDCDADVDQIVKIVANIDAGNDYDLIFTHDDAASDAENRIYTPNEEPFHLPPNGVAIFYKDQSTNRWRIVGAQHPRPRVLDITIGSDKDDYDPAGLGVADVVRTDVNTGPHLVTGFVAPSTKSGAMIKRWVNVDGSGDVLRFPHEDAASAAANRIVTPDGKALNLWPGESVTFWYDTISSRWRVLAAPVGRTGFHVAAGAFAAQQDDLTPGSDAQAWSRADTVGFTLTGNQSLTGLAAVTATDGPRLKRFFNRDADDSLTVKHEDAASTAANRIHCPNDTDLVIPPGGNFVVWYDETDSRWRASSDTGFAPLEKTDTFPIHLGTGRGNAQWLFNEADLEGCLCYLPNDTEFNRLVMHTGASESGTWEGHVVIYQSSDGTITTALAKIVDHTFDDGDVGGGNNTFTLDLGGTFTLKRGYYVILFGRSSGSGSPWFETWVADPVSMYDRDLAGMPVRFKGISSAASPPDPLNPITATTEVNGEDNQMIHKFRKV